MAESATHLAISAPTRTGKTRRILAPAVLHPGPAVRVVQGGPRRTGADRRSNGPTGVIDLRPQKTLVWPANVRRMVTDPTAGIISAEEAMTLTKRCWPPAASASAAPPAGRPLLRADFGKTVRRPRWPVCFTRAVGTRGDQKDDENHPGEIDHPSWKTAYALCPHGDLREPLMELTGMDGRVRDSVAITMKKAITPWIRLGLMSTDPQSQLNIL
jgi:hypothetical protein